MMGRFAMRIAVGVVVGVMLAFAPALPVLAVGPDETAARTLEDCRIGAFGDFTEGFPRPPTAAPSTGALTVDIVFVDFPDSSGGEAIERLVPQLPSVQARFAALSSGRFELRIRTHAEWLHLPDSITTFPAEPNGTMSAAGFDDLIGAAVAAADPSVDFGETGVVWVVYGTSGAPEISRAAANNTLAIPTDEGTLTRAVGVPSIGADALMSPVLVHETLHTLGLPDLYDSDAADGGRYDAIHAGSWDPMSDANVGLDRDLLGWHLWLLGWLDDDAVRCLDPTSSTELALRRLDARAGPAIAVVRVDLNEVVVVESRRPGAFDEYLGRSGALVSTVRGFQGSAGPVTVMPAEGRPAPVDRDGFEQIALQPGERLVWSGDHPGAPAPFAVTVRAADDAGDTVLVAPLADEPVDPGPGPGPGPVPDGSSGAGVDTARAPAMLPPTGAPVTVLGFGIGALVLGVVLVAGRKPAH
ncbi:hypothetical protein FLP10_12890 [Agromyces intestinalis]|uniref:M6 family metalloprotease domain-containing protein n=1 Tax=Agromyces intestinalis TaxID=2592652 RepID=A0A5C1YJF5_9MICO|nr:hypothetical protein [Agromyces intestinalis]QEO15217.1 hypothetical protein FLP10_12890 [Agromyces intestinalis]